MEAISTCMEALLVVLEAFLQAFNTMKRSRWLQDVPKIFPRRPKTVHVGNSVGRAQRASAASDASGAIRISSNGLLRESCSKDDFRVLEGCLRNAVQNVSPRGFILNALPVLMLTPGL